MFFSSFFKNNYKTGRSYILFKSLCLGFSIILLFSFHAVSSICKDTFPKNPFVEFAIEKLGESWKEQMPRNWEDKVMKYTRFWDVKDMENFLTYLKNRIGDEDALKRIRSISYFQSMRYKNFINQVLLYENYIGVEGVTNRLRKSLGGFKVREVSEIREVIEFIKGYIGEEASKERMKKDLESFSRTNLDELKKVISFVENYIGEEATKERMRRDLLGFSDANLNELKKVVEFVEKYIGEEATKERMRRDLLGFSKANLNELKKVVEFVEDYIGEEATKERMKKDLRGFARASLEELKEVVSFVEDYIGEEATKERMTKDLQGFSRANLNVLQSKEKLWGQQQMKNNLETYNLQNPLFSE